jgi:hypothetical protein
MDIYAYVRNDHWRKSPTIWVAPGLASFNYLPTRILHFEFRRHLCTELNIYSKNAMMISRLIKILLRIINRIEGIQLST